MTDSTRTRAGACHGRASPAKPMPPGQKPGFLAQRDLREPYLAVYHELSERLTAITNYLASALQRSEIESGPEPMPPGQPEILEKASAQVSRAHEVTKRFRQLLDEDLGEFRLSHHARNGLRGAMEAELLQAQKMEALGQLTGGVVHDINNLLIVLQGNLEMLSGHQSSDQLQAKVDMALQTIERGERLIGQLLAFARPQPLRIGTVDLNAQLRRMAELLATTVGAMISIETDLMLGLWPASADATQLELAVINLAINARDAMPAGGVLCIRTCNTTIPGVGQAGDFVTLEIADTGFGMPAETLARAFEPFFTTKEPGKGTGLGLSMVYDFTRQLGGTAAIRSEIGRGTTVTLHLPRSPKVHQDRSPSKAPSHAGFPLGVLQ
jgi:C4-dicarboxylate-specific signal transduction histidine kinase